MKYIVFVSRTFANFVCLVFVQACQGVREQRSVQDREFMGHLVCSKVEHQRINLLGEG